MTENNNFTYTLLPTDKKAVADVGSKTTYNLDLKLNFFNGI